MERYERDRRIIDEKIIRQKCDLDRRAYEEAERIYQEALKSRDRTSIEFNRGVRDRNRSDYCKCLVEWYAKARRALPPEYYRACDPDQGPLIQPGPPPTADNPPPPPPVPLAPAARHPCQAAYDEYVRLLARSRGSGGEALLGRIVRARDALCDCLRRHYGADIPVELDRFCKDPDFPEPPLLPPAETRVPVPIQEPTEGERPGREGEAPPRQPRTRTGSGAQSPNPPPPPPPPPPPAGNPNPNAPAPPGMPAADCLREGAWNVTFTVEQHNDNHDHTVCVQFLRRLLQMTLGDFLGDLFAARFEDLLPQMECTKIPGCSGSCKGTLPQFAGKENVEFEIQNLRRNGDTITGRLVITSGGQTLFILKFTATPAVTA